eukprot:CAMPEP_0203932206 /NCGR_PEP_ID=MMETSP0359-20131031/70653_1 /ASSEMBLY_ACC=CAM_ASM_000338 /TAXON_ID=268821 /ORGANISM="Scrippsiella Hangoei, Strain SHTV-5" /LENGTH=403 /DNA_ID=CAMNT_0050861631 /DNA_START=17 /DNA_END=1224 /DNA_ORIENTATION=+
MVDAGSSWATLLQDSVLFRSFAERSMRAKQAACINRASASAAAGGGGGDSSYQLVQSFGDCGGGSTCSWSITRGLADSKLMFVAPRPVGFDLAVPAPGGLNVLPLGDMALRHGMIMILPAGGLEEKAVVPAEQLAASRARSQAISAGFRFRPRRPNHPGEDTAPRPQPPSLGGFASVAAVARGLPVRLVDDAVGLREWLFFEGIEEALHAEILACKGRVVHVLDVFGSLVKVCASGTTAQLVPVHVLTDLSPREIVRHINWHEALNEQIVAGSCRKPDDFKESVLAADMDYDPGVDQTAFHDSAVSLTPPDSNHLSPWFSVRRFARSLTVGWEGVSDRVLCKTLRKGSEGRVPPDGCTISGRLLEALEISNSGRERALVGNLPRDIRFRLGDGEVCDALECAV